MDFSLPATGTPKRSNPLLALTFLVALACLALLVIDRFSGNPTGDQAPTIPGEAASAESGDLVRLAEELERRALFAQAGDVWGEIAKGRSGETLASALYRQGKNYGLAGRHADAARALTHVETLKSVDSAISRKAATAILDSLSALGKEEVRRMVLDKHASPGDVKEIAVARIGGQDITLDDLRRRLMAQAEAQLSMSSVVASKEQIRTQAKSIVDPQMKDPKLVVQVLQQVVQTEVLRREALAQGLGSDQEYNDALELFRASYLTQRLIQTKLGGVLATLTDTDLRNHYEANKEEFVEKAGIEFSYQRFSTEAAAQAAQANPVATSFVKAKTPAVSGEALEGIGRSPEATAHLLALDPGQVGSRPIQVNDSWYVFRADGRRERHERSFEEARQDVMNSLAVVKQSEAAQKLQAELTSKYQVEVLQEALEKSVGSPNSTPPGNSGGPAVGDPAVGDPAVGSPAPVVEKRL